jgi:hypothetical protein
MTQHCKVSYLVIEDYSDETLKQIIEINNVQYTVTYNPRPCNTEAELRCVFHNGIKYSTFAKFLKSIHN